MVPDCQGAPKSSQEVGEEFKTELAAAGIPQEEQHTETWKPAVICRVLKGATLHYEVNKVSRLILMSVLCASSFLMYQQRNVPFFHRDDAVDTYHRTSVHSWCVLTPKDMSESLRPRMRVVTRAEVHVSWPTHNEQLQVFQTPR
jgi:hypothetical protein